VSSSIELNLKECSEVDFLNEARTMFREALVLLILPTVLGFVPSVQMRAVKTRVSMQDTQVQAAQPTIEEWLEIAEPKLKKATIAMFQACKEIAYKVRTASCDKMACFNEFGDEQLAIDILANNVIFSRLKDSGVVATASSEETPVEDPVGGMGYSTAFDPLDGSSIIDSNFAVGTIWGTWPGN